MFVAVMLSGLLVAASSGWATSEDRKLSCEPEMLLANDSIRLWFQGLKGTFKVFDQDPGDGAEAIYTYTKVSIVELEGNKVVAEMDLSRALPAHSLCEMFERDDGYELVYHVFAAVNAPQGQELGRAGATFFYHLDADAKGAKFDLLVRGWPWVSSDSELAFDFQVHSPFGVEAASNGIGFRDRDGNEYGYIDWAESADVLYEDEREDRAHVKADVAKASNNVTVRLQYSGVEAGHIELDYDPWVGTGGYDIVDGVLYGDDWMERQLPRPVRPVYQTVDELLS